MNSLIVKDSGIHVTDGEVEVICQNQEQAAKLLYNQYDPDNCTLSWCEGKSKVPGTDGCYNQCAKKIENGVPYPIPGLRFEVKGVCCSPLAPNINHHGDCDRCSFYSEVAILSVEEEKEESQENGCKCQRCGLIYRIDIIVPDEIWEKIKPEGKPEGAGLLCHYCVIDGFLDSLDKTKFQAFSIKQLVSNSTTTENYGMQSIRLHP